MKYLLLSLILVLSASAGYLYYSQNQEYETMYKEYEAWKFQYGKLNSNYNDSVRFAIWSENYIYIQQFNAEQTGSLRLGTNAFADLTNEEYIEKYIQKELEKEEISPRRYIKQRNNSVPKSLDWVAKGAVTPVEDQGSCGSCWAFSTKETLEGLNFINNNKLEVFSAQQLTDCSTASYGCDGGYQMSTYTYTAKNGIQTEASYPYVSGNTGKATPCTYDASQVAFKNTGGSMVAPVNNESAILNAIQNQPLSVLVSASSINFQLYQSGVLSKCGTQTDHAILLTGYDQSAPEPYYTCKNSWGTGWGNKGYIQFAMTGNGIGTCAVQSSVAYPTD